MTLRTTHTRRLSSLIAIVSVVIGCVAVTPTAQAQYSDLVVFGDSLSDSGNNALVLGINAGQTITGNGYVPIQPYGSGTYSNGSVWTQRFASALGLNATPALAGGHNYAFGGAHTLYENPQTFNFPPSLVTQAGAYLQSTGGVADGNVLYVVAGGANDARDVTQAVHDGVSPGEQILATARSYAIGIGGIVDALEAAGARHIIVWDTPNVGITPAATALGESFLGGATASIMNAVLMSRLAGDADVSVFDIYGLFQSAAVRSFSNVVDACGAVQGCDPSTYLFWDGIHPTTAAHQFIADAMMTLAVAAAVPEPATVWCLVVGLVLLSVRQWPGRGRCQLTKPFDAV